MALQNIYDKYITPPYVKDRKFPKPRKFTYLSNRNKNVVYHLSGMRPGAVCDCYFDGKQIVTGIIIGADGTQTGSFSIPPRLLNNNKKFEVYDQAMTTAAVAAFVTDEASSSSAKELTNLYDKEIRFSPLPNRPIKIKQIADNLAQTFIVDSIGGAYITSVDLYLKNHDVNYPIHIHIAEMINGKPSSTILPQTVTNIAGASLTSHTNAINIAAKNKFTFDDPVYLEDGKEYCLVVYSNSSNNILWRSTIGETDMLTGKFIAAPKYNGRLFTSDNSYSWKLKTSTDIKFTIHRALFNTGTNGVFNVVNSTNELFNSFNMKASDVQLPNTSVDYKFSIGVLNNIDFQIGNNVQFDNYRTIDTTANKLNVSAILKSTNVNVSPVVNKNRFRAITSYNSINNNIKDGTKVNVGTYVSQDINLKNVASTLKVLLSAKLPLNTSIKVFYKTIGKKLTNINFLSNEVIGKTQDDTILNQALFVYRMSSVGLISKLGQVVITGYAANKIYIKSATDSSIFNSSGNATDVHFMSAEGTLNGKTLLVESGVNTIVGNFVYSGTTGEIYKKLTTNNTVPSSSNPDWTLIKSVAFDDVGSTTNTQVFWRDMSRHLDFDTNFKPNQTFIEYTYSPTIEPDADFNSFAIKVELFVDPSTPGFMPKITDLRAIAAY